MSGRTVSSAILLLVLGNLAATFCDAFIKSAGEVPILQFSFIRALCMVLFLLPFAPFVVDRKLPFKGSRIHFLRANIWVMAAVLLITSLSALPLATANAIFYTAPIMIVVLSALFLKEKLNALSVIAVVAGFAGVLVILRPTQLGWGAASALLFALTLAVSSLLIRKIPGQQNLLHSLLLTHIYALPLAFVLALWEGAEWDMSTLPFAISSSLCSVIYSLCCMLAYRHVAANQVTSAEYTGLVFATLVGWQLFNEQPDVWLILGGVLIVVPIMLAGHQDYRRRKLARIAASY